MKKEIVVRFPKISVVIATYNSKNTIEKCLKSVRSQNYPQDRIEIILVDGSSSDNTLSIAREFNVIIHTVSPKKQNAEYNKGVGIECAKGELLLLIDHDNVLPHKKWLAKMVQPFLDDKKIVGVETLRYHYDKKGDLLDRYFALYGAGDPLAFYLGKADRLSFIYDNYNLAGKVIQNEPYYIVEFDKKNIPTLGANGFMVVSKEPAILINFPTGLYNPQEEGRIPYEEAQVKTADGTLFSWDLVREHLKLNKPI